jgi:hypothetical protein
MYAQGTFQSGSLPSGFISIWPTDSAVLLPQEQPKVVFELLSDSDVNVTHEITEATFRTLVTEELAGRAACEM